MRFYLTSKIVLSFKNNAVSFLNGLTSNEMTARDNAFLNINGRVVATFDQHQVSDDEVLVVLEENFVNQVLEHVDRYVKLSKVNVERLKKKVYFDLDDNVSLESGDVLIEQNAGALLLTERDLPTDISEEKFTLFRLKNHIPLHGRDYQDEMLLNIGCERFVSFTKGCFLGQEPVSKVYNRSKPTWRLVVKSESNCTDEEKEKMTSKMKDPDSDEIIGFVFEKND